ncbi:IS607 family transposase [uncultured Dubosiella sp.]|uniref:IS607 family transposase n=1 Tax=uncultured Dubosiella sp. TaxID=1937011 RepID=UPI00207EDF26|nr:IS607 family transposase [uncultured Dubosiella sp.]GJM57159.1 hypothetical protein EROP_08520 [Erysipelotrichaceae bacterium OPF54]
MVKLTSLDKDLYKPGEAAEMLNIHVRTVQRYCNEGQLKCIRTETGRRMITRDSLEKVLASAGLLIDDRNNERKDAVYARVSTHKQKTRGDLDRQIEKVCAYAALHDPHQLTVWSDVASGLNDDRKGLNALLDEVMQGNIRRIYIHYRDRLTRFGFNYLKRVCSHFDTDIIVVSSEDKTMEEELAQDIISIIHSFSGKLYGMRRTVKEKAEMMLSDDGKEDIHEKHEPEEQEEKGRDHHPDREASVQKG